MSKGNMLMGQARKKLGSIVFYVRNGEQVQRKWTASGARKGDEASYAARAQRVQFGEAANEWIPYKYICTRMYRKGKKPTESDYNVFVKENWFRFPYMPKEDIAAGYYTLIPGVYSRGSLGECNMFWWWLPNEEVTEARVIAGAFDVNAIGNTKWTDPVENYKVQLRQAFPNASKVTIAMGFLRETSSYLQTTGRRYMSVQWYPIIFNLFTNDTEDDTTVTVSQYVSSVLANTPFAAFMDRQVGVVQSNNSLFTWYVNYDENKKPSHSMMSMIFATDDRVNDCYTTTLYNGNFSQNQGGWTIYNFLRTDRAFEAAANSYGYTKDAMQGKILVSGDNMKSNVLRYIEGLKKTLPDVGEAYERVYNEHGCECFMIDYLEFAKLLKCPKSAKQKKE